MKKFYVYIDRLESGPHENEIIYIGKGNESRINFFERNQKYNRKYLKYGIRREIFLETEDEKFAFNEEIRLIAEYHTNYKDPLATKNACNFTVGGEGRGKSHQARENISQRTKEAMEELDPSWKTRQRDAMKRSEVKEKISERTKLAMNRPDVKDKCVRTSEMKKRISQKLVGHEVSDETKRKISESNRGRIPPNKGRKLSEEARKKISENTRKAMSNLTIRENVSQRVKEAMQRPEVKEKLRSRQAKSKKNVV